MANKIFSLNIGVTKVDSSHYGDAVTNLPCCKLDAEIMYRMGKLFNYDEQELLVDERATTVNVKAKILEYSRVLEADDICIITYSGHGSKLPDLNSDEREGEDQTWCLFDRQLVDDEVRLLWKEFKKGVSIFVLLDSCHSGTAIKPLVSNDMKFPISKFEKQVVTKAVDTKYHLDTYLNNKHIYDPILSIPILDISEIKASVLSFSACQDDELARAGSFLSFFTNLLINSMENDEHATENYFTLYEKLKIESHKILGVTPNLVSIGFDLDDSESYFYKSKPFIRYDQNYPKEIETFNRSLRTLNLTKDSTEPSNTAFIIDIQNDISRDRFYSIIGNEVKNLDEDSLFFHDPKLNSKGIAKSPWDLAYRYHEELLVNGIKAFVEPSSIPKAPLEDPVLESTDHNDYLRNWPSPLGEDNEFTWYQGPNYSQLAEARNAVLNHLQEKDLEIHIAHIDTGYVENHPGLPPNLSKGANFVPGEEGEPPIDVIRVDDKKLGEQNFHGTATLSLLAGNKVPKAMAYPPLINDEKFLEIGAIPFAHIHPIRISDTVAFFLGLENTIPFVKAINWAKRNNCEVISMSMGGAPIRAWAKAIDEAYEAGITIVVAGGNSWVKGLKRVLPKKLVFPSRFDRVIAVTGVCFNQEPYVFNANSFKDTSKSPGGEFMQGNIPTSFSQRSTIAAYTPNVPWAQFVLNKPVYLKNGGGTSSATPQVAAAAALWILKNRKELKEKGYSGNWRQVEAIKYALFNSADKTYPLYKKYYGMGVLKANDALTVQVPNEANISEARKSKISPLGILEIIKTMILRKNITNTSGLNDNYLIKSEMIFQEILQVLEIDPHLSEIYNDLDILSDFEKIDEKSTERELNLLRDQFYFLFKKVQESSFSSDFIKNLQ